MDSSLTSNKHSTSDLVRIANEYESIATLLSESNCFVIAEISLEGKLLQANAGAEYVFFSDFIDEKELISQSFINPAFSALQESFTEISHLAEDTVLFEGIINVGNPALMVHSLKGRILRHRDCILVIAEHEVHELIKLNQKVVDLNNELANAHRNMAKMNRDIKAQKQKAEKLLITDQLTQAPNRYALNQRMDEELARFQRYHQPMVFALLDIDRFKSVNDEFGHDVGDQALIYLADWLKKQLRKSDFFARWGGEEFVIMFPGTHLDDAYLVLDRIREDLANVIFEPIGRPLTFSAGILDFGFDLTLDDIFKLADAALYRSKEEGRNRISRAVRKSP